MLVLELWDEDGVRRIDHQRSKPRLTSRSSDRTRMDPTSKPSNPNGWKTACVDQLERIRGSGTFGFVEQDGRGGGHHGTVHDFHQWSEDGETVADRLHVDGVLTGDAEGTFGIVRDIEATLDAESASGVIHGASSIRKNGSTSLASTVAPSSIQALVPTTTNGPMTWWTSTATTAPSADQQSGLTGRGR